MSTNEKNILNKKFHEQGHQKISDFTRAVKSELTQETWGAVLNRDKSPDLRTLLKMTAELNFTPEELKKLLVARGEHRIAQWIAPAPVSPEEQRFIEKLRALNGDKVKVKLVNDLLDNLRG